MFRIIGFPINSMASLHFVDFLRNLPEIRWFSQLVLKTGAFAVLDLLFFRNRLEFRSFPHDSKQIPTEIL
jgi:hypothetical protein